MIVLDTHIWVWWVHGDPRLTLVQQHALAENEQTGLGVSAISCWEVAKLVEYKRLVLPSPTLEWLDQALAYPGVQCYGPRTRLSSAHRRREDPQVSSRPGTRPPRLTVRCRRRRAGHPLSAGVSCWGGLVARRCPLASLPVAPELGGARRGRLLIVGVF